ACTRVPRVAASLGFSGSRSMTRNRYSSGHCMKSLARDGDSEAGGSAAAPLTAAASAAAPGGASGAGGVRSATAGPLSGRAGSSVLVSMPQTLRPGADIDGRAGAPVDNRPMVTGVAEREGGRVQALLHRGRDRGAEGKRAATAAYHRHETLPP